MAKRSKYTKDEIQKAQAMLEKYGSERKAAKALGISRGRLRSLLSRRSAESDRIRPNTPLYMVDPDTGLEIDKRQKVYVITCAQNNTPVNLPFLQAIQTYAHRRNAQILVIPIRYKNPTGYGSEEQDDAIEWAPELFPYILTRNLDIGEHLTVFGKFQIQATAARPLSGLETIGRTKSGIFGHPNLAFETVPTAMSKIPRILATTGTVTQRNYSRTKLGQKADLNHHAGAIVVEESDGMFHLRHISDSGDGSFYDLTCRYHPDGRIERGIRLSGLVLGDLHVEKMDKYTHDVLFHKDGMIKVLNPRKLVIHDAIDCTQISHHATIFNCYEDNMSLYRAGSLLMKVHNKLVSDSDLEIAYVESNHFPGHAQQWLERYRPTGNYELDMLYHTMSLHCMYKIRKKQPINLYEAMGLQLDRAIYLTRNDLYLIEGIDCSQHGDKGPNGSRGSVASFAKTGYKTIIGHSHTPRIFGGCWQGGTMSKLNMGYNGGYSSWHHTNVGIYPDGNRTFLTLIGNKWNGTMEGF